MDIATDPVVEELFSKLPLRFEGFSRTAIALGCALYTAFGVVVLAAFNGAENMMQAGVWLVMISYVSYDFLEYKMRQKQKEFVANVAAYIKETHNVPSLSVVRKFDEPSFKHKYNYCMQQWKDFFMPLLVIMPTLGFALMQHPFVVFICVAFSLIAALHISLNLCETMRMNSRSVIFEAIQVLHGVTVRK